MADVLVDAGPLIALFNGNDLHHQRCLNWIKSSGDRLVTTPGVLTEASHVLNSRIGIEAALDCLVWSEAAILIQDTGSHLGDAIAIMQQYRDLPADLADAKLVDLANRTGTFRVATIDIDFTVYQGAAREVFEYVIP